MMVTKISDLKPDMVLASDIINFEGRFLMAAGTVLTNRSIGMLKAWGVVQANIRGHGSEDNGRARESVDPDALATARAMNEKRFARFGPNNPVMIELEALSSLRMARSIESGTPVKTAFFQGPETELSETEGEQLTIINPNVALSQIGRRLPMLPAVFSKINETIMNPDSSASDMASAVSQDPGLTYQLLGLVNSSFYGFVSKIDTVSRAVAIVGTRQLTNLVFGISIIKFFDNIPPDQVDMKGFWKHSVACGIASRIIAGYNKLQNTERLFVAGLLHDIGRLLMFRLWPEHSRRVIVEARRLCVPLYQVEGELLGVDHAGIGAHMAEHWRLPFLLETAIRNHHTPKESHNRLESSIVHLADVIVNAMEMGSSGEVAVQAPNDDALQCLQLRPNLLAVIVEQVDRQLDEAMEYFFPERGH